MAAETPDPNNAVQTRGGEIPLQKGREKNMLKKTFVLFFIIVTGLAFALSPAARAATKLHFGMPAPKPNVVHIPVYLALDRGFYKAQGLDVKISRFRGGTRAHQAITAKGTDLDLA